MIRTLAAGVLFNSHVYASALHPNNLQIESLIRGYLAQSCSVAEFASENLKPSLVFYFKFPQGNYELYFCKTAHPPAH